MKAEPCVGEIPNNLIVPKELLLSWAAGLVRAVCGVDDDIAEPVRQTALQMTTLMERARPRTIRCRNCGATSPSTTCDVTGFACETEAL